MDACKMLFQSHRAAPVLGWHQPPCFNLDCLHRPLLTSALIVEVVKVSHIDPSFGCFKVDRYTTWTDGQRQDNSMLISQVEDRLDELCCRRQSEHW